MAVRTGGREEAGGGFLGAVRSGVAWRKPKAGKTAPTLLAETVDPAGKKGAFAEGYEANILKRFPVSYGVKRVGDKRGERKPQETSRTLFSARCVGNTSGWGAGGGGGRGQMRGGPPATDYSSHTSDLNGVKKTLPMSGIWHPEPPRVDWGGDKKGGKSIRVPVSLG